MTAPNADGQDRLHHFTLLTDWLIDHNRLEDIIIELQDNCTWLVVLVGPSPVIAGPVTLEITRGVDRAENFEAALDRACALLLAQLDPGALNE